MPITVGGGVKNISDFRILLNSGADKISINTIALTNPELISESAELFGAQCVVVSIDYKVDAELTQKFFATVQNKMHYAVHGCTAAEIITKRVDSKKPLMGLTSFKGDYITTNDISVAKKYLTEEEINTLVKKLTITDKNINKYTNTYYLANKYPRVIMGLYVRLSFRVIIIEIFVCFFNVQ